MLDVIVFGPHPDDAELGCGGAIAKATKAGYQVGIIDLTAGEKGTKGSSKLRLAEAEASRKKLNVTLRENLHLPDSFLAFEDLQELAFKVANKIREFTPKVVFCPYWEDRHPDHIATAKIVTQAYHYAKLKKVELDYPEYTLPHIIYYEINQAFPKPSFLLDITAEFELKKKAIMSYTSQFKEFTKEYLPFPLVERCTYYGSLINCDYGEAFLLKKPLKLTNWKAFLEE
jgi:bacillithiol biosynthesis deacetylase BshB1